MANLKENTMIKSVHHLIVNMILTFGLKKLLKLKLPLFGHPLVNVDFLTSDIPPNDQFYTIKWCFVCT